MKKIITLVLINLIIQTTLFSQVNLWKKDAKRIKTKGIICRLAKEGVHQIELDSMAFIGAATVVGALLPYAIKYGNYAIKKATSKDEKDYKSEYKCLNKLDYDYKTIKNYVVQFSANKNYYPKGETSAEPAGKYIFQITNSEPFIKIELVSIEEQCAPVKLKKKYDLIIENFDISIQALVLEQIDDGKYAHRIIDLGAQSIYYFNPGFTNANGNIINEGNFLIPSFSDDGNELTLVTLTISCKINHVNPYGLTKSNLNDFLEKNSDTNEEFLNSILIQTDDK